MELESSQSYANFRAWCPRKEVSIGVLHPIPWRYYDWGPKTYPEPIVCLHSLIGSAESFYQQIIALAPRGYRIISIQIPVYWTVAEFCDAFHAFLETIPHHRLHLYGAGLGGFLAMHYAVRKPERVASLILTHSFLTTENLNLRIPYSATILRWLPDFLIRSTMRAILPKGRVSLEMANAAEFAIGHTMICSRDVLASRMTLSVTSSTVVKRVHIPETSITLIDSLDRQAPALELSELTAAQLPNARRAHLKTGGDFPYISVPDDVNVHLIVHLRRNGADPVTDLPVPVPARPRVLPEATLRRRAEEARRHAEGDKIRSDDLDGSAKKVKRVKRSAEELQKAARAIVAADERSRIERFAFEIGRLREFLPDRNDSYLSTVLDQCGGNLDTAISNALDGQYGDGFYETVFGRAIEETVESLRAAEEENKVDKDEDEINVENGTMEEGDQAENPGNPQVAAGESGSEANAEPVDGADIGEVDIVTSYKRRSIINRDPLGEAEFVLNDTQPNAHAAATAENGDDEKNTTDGDSGMALSAGVKSSEADSESLDMRDDDPLVGLKPRDGSRTAMSSVDLGVNELYLNTESGDAASTERGSPKDGSMKSDKQLDYGTGTGSRRQRRSRRRSYPQTADAVGAYVSSEKVGMRSRGPLVGRGPAPFSNATVERGLNPGEAWMRTPRIRDEEGDEGTTKNDEKTHVSLSSGASLLEANENPLELPGHETQYSPDRSHQRPLPSSSLEHRFGRESAGSQSKTSTPPMPPRHGVGQTEGSGLMAPEPELLLGSNEKGKLKTGQDEWESFRRRERGLAGVIPSPPSRPLERTLEKGLEGTELGVSVEGESEESARLREWRMSAQAASKNVHR